MKRREFILGTGAAAGLLLAGGARAATPCSPQLAGTSNFPCPIGSFEDDWAARTSAPGVVWAHDFRSSAEVDAFRWAGGYGNDPLDTYRPGRCIWNNTDGITGGGCLELIHPVGSGNAPGWWRPFSPMSGASNGRGQDDSAANGAIPLQPWDPSNRRVNEQFRQGYYAHSSYVGADGYSNSQFDGSEFWLQFRIKIDSNRYLPGTPAHGKQSFLATTQKTLNQEIVQMNRSNRWASWYTRFGSSPDTGGAMGAGGYNVQPGGDYSACGGLNGDGSGCWKYADNEWVTWLYHLVPGTHDNKDTLFEAFVARPGQHSYETVFSQLNTVHFSSNFSGNAYGGHPFGWNSFQPSNYMNGQTTTVQWYQRYDQIILSKSFIPCPQI